MRHAQFVGVKGGTCRGGKTAFEPVPCIPGETATIWWATEVGKGQTEQPSCGTLRWPEIAGKVSNTVVDNEEHTW